MDNDPFTLDTTHDEECLVIVRVKTTRYKTKRGFALTKSFDFLKRQCKGFNFVEEDIDAVGADEILRWITNLDEISDGVYKMDIINPKRDWETGMVEEYDYRLTPHA